jgi:hypothetical protein
MVYAGGVGPQRNPVTVEHYAIIYYDSYKKTGNQTLRQAFINNTNWLASNAISHGNYSIFEYKFPWPPYASQPPWHSAMAQAQALQPLIKAYKITGNERYLETANLLLNTLFIEVKNGGVTYKTPHDGWWYEEVASNALEEPRVLNGMMYALLGIYDYYNYTKSDKAKFLFDQGIVALKNNLPRYDYKNEYSYYSMYPIQKLSPLYYHKKHIELLSNLYNITKEEVFKSYRDKWQNYKIPEPVYQLCVRLKFRYPC